MSLDLKFGKEGFLKGIDQITYLWNCTKSPGNVFETFSEFLKVSVKRIPFFFPSWIFYDKVQWSNELAGPSHVLVLLLLREKLASRFKLQSCNAASLFIMIFWRRRWWSKEHVLAILPSREECKLNKICPSIHNRQRVKRPTIQEPLFYVKEKMDFLCTKHEFFFHGHCFTIEALTLV